LSGDASKTLAKSAGIVALGSVLSKILGFLRESALASEFGASYATDAYLMAMIIPTLMLFGVGPAVTTTLIPVFTDLEKRKGRDAAFKSRGVLHQTTPSLWQRARYPQKQQLK
jgi:putative peptidoglycan lipid II flippase